MKITESEKKIVNLIHLSNKEIAEKLVIAVPTVKAHIHHLLLKYKAKNRTDLVLKIMEDNDRRIIMLSVNEINMLKAQNEALKKQNQELQQELREIRDLLKDTLEKLK